MFLFGIGCLTVLGAISDLVERTKKIVVKPAENLPTHLVLRNNMLGTTVYGRFRRRGVEPTKYAVYVFFMVFLIPLVPLKCYLVSAPDKDWRYEVHRELEINGYEAAGIMLKIYMGISLTLGMVLIIVALLLK